MNKIKEFSNYLKDVHVGLDKLYPISFNEFHNSIKREDLLIIDLDYLLKPDEFMETLKNNHGFGEVEIKKQKDKVLTMIPELNGYIKKAMEFSKNFYMWNEYNDLFPKQEEIIKQMEKLLCNLEDLNNFKRTLKKGWDMGE